MIQTGQQPHNDPSGMKILFRSEQFSAVIASWHFTLSQNVGVQISVELMDIEPTRHTIANTNLLKPLIIHLFLPINHNHSQIYILLTSL